VRELLRPPPHRGPLIAAGAVVLAAGLILFELRLMNELSDVVHFLVLGVPAGIILALGLQAPNEDGSPPAYQSVLLVTGLLLLEPALLRLADVLGAENPEDFPAGELTWTLAVVAGVALYASIKRNSAICLLLAAIAGVGALLAAWEWVFAPGTFTASRWLLALSAAGLVMAGLMLRDTEPRRSELLIDAAGLAVLTIALQGVVGALFSDDETIATVSASALPDLWELVVFGAGVGLLAYGALDRSPGPAWLGFANLVAFVVVVGTDADETLYFWPLALLLVGGLMMGAGLRPREPLPPEPDAYRAGEQPLASRTADDELVMRVRVDDAPPSGSVSDR
jgi:hypothetical protein